MIQILILILLFVQSSIGSSLGISDVRVVQASDVEAKIKTGHPAEFDNCIIDGNLNLGRLRIDGTVHFNHTVFQNSANFESTIFNGDANFRGSIFKGNITQFKYAKFNNNAYFMGSQFNNNAYFVATQFNMSADFADSRFNGSIEFYESQFNSYANFDSSLFNNSVYFKKSLFEKNAYFGNTNFSGLVDFHSTSFNNIADFTGSQFQDMANFSYSNFNKFIKFNQSQFNGSADFIGSHFNGTAYFIGAKFKGSAHFKRSIFYNTAYFYGSRFSNSADFSDIVFNKEIAFSDSKFSSDVIFNNSRFNEDALFEDVDIGPKLYLKRTKYNNLYIRWNNITELAYDDTAYISLMENFKKLGYFEDYDNCYFKYRVKHREQSWSSMGFLEWGFKRIDEFLQYSYGYGTKPILPIIWSIIINICFYSIWGSIIFERKFRQIKLGLAQNQNIWDILRSLSYPLILSLTIFLSGSRLFVDPPKIPEISDEHKSIINILFNFERVLGALFSILFFFSLGKTIIR